MHPSFPAPTCGTPPVHSACEPAGFAHKGNSEAIPLRRRGLAPSLPQARPRMPRTAAALQVPWVAFSAAAVAVAAEPAEVLRGRA